MEYGKRAWRKHLDAKAFGDEEYALRYYENFNGILTLLSMLLSQDKFSIAYKIKKAEKEERENEN